MSETTIKPERITKPIQLLGAWLAGLFSIDACFLFAATRFAPGAWEAGVLTISAIVNVPLFLGAVFLLQTRFRPELQEDSYYSSYLSQKTNRPILVQRQDLIESIQAQVNELEARIAASEASLLARKAGEGSGNVAAISADGTSRLPLLVFGVNKYFSDKDKLAEALAKVGVKSYTLFGGTEPPKDRIVAISEHLPKDTINEVIDFITTLGFRRYNLYDNHQENSSEDVLLGSYGTGNHLIATAEQPKRAEGGI